MNAFQRFAAGHFLSDYPADMSWADLMEWLEEKEDTDEDDKVKVWETFEHYNGYSVAELMQQMVSDLQEFFVAK